MTDAAPLPPPGRGRVLLRTLRNAFWLAGRNLIARKTPAAILAGGVGLALFLPLFAAHAHRTLAAALLARADASPVLIGRRGDGVTLTMRAMTFRGSAPEAIPIGSRALVEDRGYGLVVPLHLGHTASSAPVVGTTPEYLERRGLQVAAGRPAVRLGEAVAGAAAAAAFDLAPGDTVRTDLTDLYNLAGAYPLQLEVTGILAPRGTPDDAAFFVGLTTAWAIDGSWHGHAADAADTVEASAATFLFQEVDDRNRASFHPHGDEGALPVTALLVFPRDDRARDELLGDLNGHDTLAAVRPARVMRDLLGLVLRLRRALEVVFAAVGVSTLGFAALALSLSLRLRAAELDLMRRMGASRGVIGACIAAEIVLVVSAAAGIALTADAVGVALLRRALIW